MQSNNFGSLLSCADSKLSFISANTSIRYARLSLAAVSGNSLLQISHLFTSIFTSLSGGISQVQADVSYTFESILVRVKVLIFYKDAISVKHLFGLPAALSCIRVFGLGSFKSIPLSKNIKH